MKKYIKTLPLLLCLFLLVIICISCEELLFEKDISNEKMIVVAPKNDSNFLSTSIIFTWEKVTGATNYQLQIVKPSFENANQMVLDTLVSSNSFTQQLNIGQYQWRIRAVNSAYSTPYTVANSFLVLNNEDFQNNTPVLITPKNNFTTNVVRQNLSWQRIIGATAYEVQVLNADKVVLKDSILQNTAIDFTLPEGSLIWKVRASSGDKKTLFSERSITVDTKAPNTAVLTSPVDKSTTTTTNINFQFSRTAIAGSTEKDSIYVYTESALTTLKFKEQITLPYTKELTTGSYYWYIKSFDEAKNESPKSAVFSFTIN